MVIRVTNPFRNLEEKFITAIEQYWNEHKQIPTGERLIMLGVIQEQEQFNGLMESDYVLKALDVLGIKVDADLQILTPKQLAAAQVMFDFHDGRSDIKKLKDLGINGQTWDNWLKDPIFQAYLQNRAGGLFEDNIHEIDRALFAKARTGNVEAIRLVHQMTGRFQTVEVPKIGQVEAHVFIMKLFEVLQMHLISEPDKLRAISEGIMNIQSPYMNHPKVIEAIHVN